MKHRSSGCRLLFTNIIGIILGLSCLLLFLTITRQRKLPESNLEELMPVELETNDHQVAPQPPLLATVTPASSTIPQPVWRIIEPKAGDTVNGVIPIVGIADFDPAVEQFYRIELGIIDGLDIQWPTLGEPHREPVVNGTLEVLHAEALPPGNYFLRLVVIKNGKYVGEPHTIPITIGGD